MVLVAGDAGIGKSTLIVEAARQANVDLYLGHCMHLGGEEVALAPLADLLRQIRRAKPDEQHETANSPLFGWLHPNIEASPGAPAGGLFAPVLELVSGLAADDAVVVGFEDLHWADVGTWDLFEFLARNLVDDHVVLIGSYRANATGGHPLQRRRLAELTASPSRTGSTSLASTAARSRPESPRSLGESFPPTRPSSRRSSSVGQGNPFFTEDSSPHLAGEAIPVVLSDLIAADVAGLDRAPRRALRRGRGRRPRNHSRLAGEDRGLRQG